MSSKFPVGSLSRRRWLTWSGASLAATLGGAAWLRFYGGAPTSSQPLALVPSGTASKGPRRAKRVIYLYQAGGPSQLDMFDYRPALARWHGKPLPDSVRNGQRLTDQTAGQESFPVAASPFKFRQYGQSGAWISELLPYTAGIADQLCFIKSVHTEAINHVQGASLLLTGNQQAGWPSIGAWVGYALGSGNASLPTSVVMISHGTALGNGGQPVLDRYWSNGFLPTRYRGVKFRSSGPPVLYLEDPPGITRESRREMFQAIAKLNGEAARRWQDPQIESRTEQYAMALEMQRTIPDLVDLSDEPEHTFELYGEEARSPGTYAANCLLARRMAERGVRFIQLCHRGWDAHSDVSAEVAMQCRDVDRPSAALIRDLDQRGLLEETLVVFASEFGRTVYSQGDLSSRHYGRDHHPRCFTVWLAGAGIRPGLTYGETDDLGYNVVADPVHIHDLNATILSCLGIDHERLTFTFQGRQQRLTNVSGRVVSAIVDAPAV